MNTFINYVLIFYISSFIGWLQEVIQTIINDKKFINRGFLIGPICPVYGFGSMAITFFLTKYESDPLVVFFGATIICAILEYFTSWAFEKVFKARWWDYSDMPYNINGRICLLFSLAFGLGALLIIYFLNPIVIAGINKHVSESVLLIISIVLLSIQALDMIVSFSIISKLKNVSNSIRSDNTEQITKEVKKYIYNSTKPYRRLLESFPDIKIYNSMVLIKKRLTESRKKYLEKKNKEKVKYKEARKNANKKYLR